MSDAAIKENIRSLRAEGYSEAEAIKLANKSDSPEDEDSTPAYDGEESPSQDRQFVIVTKDYSGLGWAKKLMEEGETVTLAGENPEDKPEFKKLYDMVAKDWIPRMDLSEAMGKLQTDSTYWIFAENNFTEEAEMLRKKGQRVFGTSTLSEKLEHDRNYAVQIAEEAGLSSPPTHEFTSKAEGVAFLDANPDKAYVFKPDDSGGTNYSTFVPIRKADKDANRETYTYLAHMKAEPGAYILQERIPIEEGTEANAEVWLFEGEPILAFLGLEVKRKNTYDLGEMAGCGGDVVSMIPLDCKLVTETIGKMLPFYQEQKYTGFADVNIIFTKDGPKFLEVCNRFGYSAHVTLFLALAQDGFGNILADFIDGNVEGMAERFRAGFGSSLTMFLDHPREGMPIHVDTKYTEMFYPFDGYMDDDTLLLAGYSNEIGIYVAFGNTLGEAAKNCKEQLAFDEAVSVPDMYYRWDLDETNYYNAPVTRYKALQKMGLL
jgi:phosphoribosylamine--glycine ligase